MQSLKSFFGYVWSVATIFIALATFLGHTHLSKVLAETTGITVHPRYSGGEIVRTLDHGNYKTFMHRPVFDGLTGQTREGFIQVKWEPAAGLPEVIREGFDYSHDGLEDFSVTLNTVTGETTLSTSNPSVLGMGKAYHLKNGWAVRVLLKRQPDFIQ